jgi:hypothetical protein
MALTPSPSPIRWERVAAGRVRGMDVFVGVSVHKYLRPSAPSAVRDLGLQDLLLSVRGRGVGQDKAEITGKTPEAHWPTPLGAENRNPVNPLFAPRPQRSNSDQKLSESQPLRVVKLQDPTRDFAYLR